MKFVSPLLFLFTVLTALAADPIVATERSQLADGLLARGLYELAATEYESLLKDYPAAERGDVVHFRLGECYRHLGERTKADKAYRTVYSQYPNSDYRFRAHFRRADLFMENGRMDVAIPLYESLLKENPPDELAAPARYFLGEAYLHEGREQDAIDTFAEVQKHHPDSTYAAYALLKKGSVRGGRDNPADQQAAIRDLEAALAGSGSDRVTAEALFQLAELHFERGDYASSAGLYARLIRDYAADPRSQEAQLRAAWAQQNSGAHEQALIATTANMNAAEAATRPDWLYLRANCQRQLAQNREAIATYESLLKLQPDGRLATAARHEIAVCWFRDGRFREAIDAARVVTITDANAKDLYWLQAEAHAAVGAIDDAITFYRHVVDKFPTSSIAGDALYRLAYHQQRQGDYGKAAVRYRQLAADYAQHELATQALFAAAYCLNENSETAAAVDAWRAFAANHAADPHVEEALYRQGLAEIRLDRSADAQQTLGALLTRFPSSPFAPDGHFWLGMLALNAGKPGDAEAAFRRALAANPREDLVHQIEFQLALVLRETGKSDEAAERIQPLVASALGDKIPLPLLQWLAEYQYEQKRFSDALAAATHLVDRSSEPVWQQIGSTLAGRAVLAAGDRDGAGDAFAAALECKAETVFAAEAALRLAEIRLDQERYVDAERFFKQAASLAADDAMLAIRANAYMGLGRTSKARGELEPAARYFMSVAILFDDPELGPASLDEAANLYKALNQPIAWRQAVTELQDRYPDSAQAKQRATGSTP
ncbi:MAG: tetratricopeptide repeat protein [Verrucomicrobia bacterium]|nr:tetratricopeptide repeat protein [Verrucomicrobiota bacterium]